MTSGGRKDSTQFRQHQPRLRGIFALLALSLAGTGLFAVIPKPQQREARHEVEQLEETFRAAMLNGDATALSSLLADDYMGITASGTLQTKENLLAELRSGKVRFTVLNISDRKIRFYGATALVTCQAEIKGTTPEGAVSGSDRYTRVYVRQTGGTWKIVSFEASPIRTSGEHK